MIKGMTLVREVASADALDKFSRLMLALGFEQGKGWQDETSRAVAFGKSGADDRSSAGGASHPD
jgi:hypothetical protein